MITSSLISITTTIILITLNHTTATTIEIDSNGKQQKTQPTIIKATFTNTLPTTELNLYWTGNGKNGINAAPKIFYGPIKPNGGERIVQGYNNQVFVVTKSGTMNERLGEFILSEDEIDYDNEQRFVIDEGVVALAEFLPNAIESQNREILAKSCRLITKQSNDKLTTCQTCVAIEGCGYSPVRDNNDKESCFISHPIATINDINKCNELYNNGIFNPSSKSVDAWINLATSTLSNKENKSLQIAYRYLEMAAQRAKLEDGQIPNNIAMSSFKKASVYLAEMQYKLDAVFDDEDAYDLITSSRHPNLAKIHSTMPMVPRRTIEEAKDYIIRGEPVVITNAFHNRTNIDSTNPIYKWDMHYLNKKVFNSTKDRFNIAADVSSQCCKYFEPQGKSKKAGYPYPFSPSTHLYRDSFDGFVKTVRQGYEISNASENGAKSSKKVLHYLHEIVMNDRGKATVAGGSAPKQFEEDINTIAAQLRKIAVYQPFFGNFHSAKLWIGQRGIIMPNHYDATDNLYVMIWGRKRAIIGEPGQLNAMYRYPNEHPLTGSSQVNLTALDLDRHPNFKNAKLREVIVGPGDILYLPAWWWHQFEQPFEDTAALNLWSLDRKDAPNPIMRDVRIREHGLADQLERSVVQLFGNEAGVILSALANEGNGNKHALFSSLGKDKLKKAKNVLYSAAESWRGSVRNLPGGHIKTFQSAAQLVQEYLHLTHRDVMGLETFDKISFATSNWSPGESWDLSKITKLPRDLRSRCEPAKESSPFMSICG